MQTSPNNPLQSQPQTPLSPTPTLSAKKKFPLWLIILILAIIIIPFLFSKIFLSQFQEGFFNLFSQNKAKMKSNPITGQTNITFKDDEGKEFAATVTTKESGSVKIPDNFPKILIYPNFTAKYILDLSDQQANMPAITVQGISQDSPKTIYNYYQNYFQSNNWQINMQTASEQFQIMASKDNRFMQITASLENNQTQLVLLYGDNTPM